MIPKIIHYCWFGRSPLPELAKKCIISWKKYLPDYEIKEWNEDNFNVNIVPYTAEAYKAKKYAFVSDYARFWILYKYGGLYFDTDVEIIKPINDIIEKGAFIGCELSPCGKNLCPSIAPGLGLGASPGLSLYKEILESYNNRHLYSKNGVLGETVVQIITKMCKERMPHIDLSVITTFQGIYCYPWEYFSPIIACTGKKHISVNTRSIHHYTATWKKKKKKPRHQRAYLRLKYICIRLYGQFIWPLFHNIPQL